MEPSFHRPKHLYKILDAAPPDPIPAALPLSPLDSQDGFIHLSTAKQVPGTAGRFFSHHTALWLLKMKLASLENGKGEVKWEKAGDHGTFAHLYGADIGNGEVDEVLVFERGGQRWEDTLDGLEE